MSLACACTFTALLIVSGCKTETTSSENSRKQVDPSVSRKLTIVSPAFLSKENEAVLQSSHDSPIAFAKDGAGIAFVEPFKDKFRVVHNGKAGKSYRQINELLISSDGKRIAYVAIASDNINKIVLDGREDYLYGANDNHLFSPDGKHHIATCSEGDKRYIVIDGKVNRNYSLVRGPVISADSSAVAFSIKAPDGNGMQFIVSDINLKNRAVFDSCGEFIVRNEDGSSVAVSCSEGGSQSVKLLDLQSRSVIADTKIDGALTQLQISADRQSVLYTVERKGNQRYVVYKGKEERIPSGNEFFSAPLALSAPEGVGVIIGTVYKSYLYRAFQKRNKKGREYGYISDYISSKDGRHNAYVATNVNDVQMHIVVDGKEGQKFDKIVSPIFSSDGDFLVYRARQAGRRFVVVSDLKGKVVNRHKEYDMVFQPAFTADGKSVAYGVLDGNEFWWKVEKL